MLRQTWPRPASGILQNAGIHEKDISEGNERREAGEALGFYVVAILSELEVSVQCFEVRAWLGRHAGE